jgi:hypothetical protein
MKVLKLELRRSSLWLERLEQTATKYLSFLTVDWKTRIAIFFTASAIAGAFSGLLAFGIANMDGVGGYEGWRWVI